MKRKYKVGTKAPYHKLTNRAVRNIRAMYEEDDSVMAIARKHKVSPKTVRDIVNRHTWKHL